MNLLEQKKNLDIYSDGIQDKLKLKGDILSKQASGIISQYRNIVNILLYENNELYKEIDDLLEEKFKGLKLNYDKE